MHQLGRDCVVMYLWTSTRGAEFSGMRPEHVRKESDGWWWTCPKVATKNARHAQAVDLRVPLVGAALKVIQRRLDGVGSSGWLFEDARGEQYIQHDFSTYIYSLQPYSAKAAAREGEGLVLPVTNWTPHDLRRTARTLLASIGCRCTAASHRRRRSVGVRAGQRRYALLAGCRGLRPSQRVRGVGRQAHRAGSE